jgi:penicillin-insensitive murein endopeptidase
VSSLPFAAPIALAALVATVVSGAGVFPAPPAHHAGMRTARVTLGPAALRFGRSLGSPTEGHLVGGMHVEETAAVRIVPADTAGDVRWGLEPLVMMLDRAARQVRRQYPQVVLSVGHLSREGGGEIDQSRSHESGRDADVGFYVRTATGKQLFESHFVPFRADGTAASWPGAYFDDAKNWALVAAMLTDPEARVTHVFVAAPLRARLLTYAEKSGVAPALRLHAAEIMQQPHGTLPHDDHFHVRIGCPAHMTECIENPAARVRTVRAADPALARGRRGPITHAPAGNATFVMPVTPAPSHAIASASGQSEQSERSERPEQSEQSEQSEQENERGPSAMPPLPRGPTGPTGAGVAGASPAPAAHKSPSHPGAAPDPRPSARPGSVDEPASPPASLAVPLDDVDG